MITNSLLAVDCEWDEWQTGLCSKTCGGGLQTNTRTEKVSQKHGGKECSGSASVEESCNTQECPGKSKSVYIELVYKEDPYLILAPLILLSLRIC